MKSHDNLPVHKMEKIELPRVVLRYESMERQLDKEQESAMILDKLVWENNKGIFQYIQGAEQPQKNLVSQDAMWALNVAKRNFVELIRLFSKWFFAPMWLFFAILPWFLKKKVIGMFVHSYCEISWRPLSPHLIKTEYMTDSGKELEWFVYSFLDNLGVENELCTKFSEVFSHLFELDNAYRLRLEDIFSETTRSLLVMNINKEIARLTAIMVERDTYAVGVKIKMLSKLLQAVLWHPRIRKALLSAISQTDISKLGFDEIDRYWVCFRTDYKFMGKTLKERKDIIKNMKQPTLIKTKYE